MFSSFALLRAKSALMATGMALAMAGPASAQESFTTLFGVLPNPVGPTLFPDQPGELVSDVGLFPSAAVLNGLEDFTSFNVQNLDDGLLGGGANEGQTIFLQNANFYVGGGQINPDPPSGPIAQQQISEQGQINLAGIGIADTDPITEGLQTFNNRIYGVFGEGRSDIVFDAGVVTELNLQAGITVEDFSVGGNTAFGQSLPAGSPLADGNGTLLIYTELGLEATISLADAGGLDDASLINQDLFFSVDDFEGNSITRLSIINEGALNSATFLSELTVTTVPEPTALALLSLGGLTLIRRRRA